MELLNQTPFLMGRMIVLDKKGAEHLIVVLKATYSIAEQGELSLADEQALIQEADDFYDEPDNSSIKHEAELGPVKPATDVFLMGSAQAPRSGTTVMDIHFRVGPVAKTARIFGDRIWKKSFGRPKASAPKPFESIPLVYENAYGGQDLSANDQQFHSQEPRNPVGRGFRSKKSRAPWAGTLLPNIENPRQLIGNPRQEVTPTGFGPIGRNWVPRVDYAGTYDQKWIEECMPILPQDFDERFHNAAPPDLVTSGYLNGGELVEVIGCTRSGRLNFSLPRVEPWAFVQLTNRVQDISLKCNSVTVDTDRMQLFLIWKGEMYIHQEALNVEVIETRLEGEEQGA
jgi:hypothetical protein